MYGIAYTRKNSQRSVLGIVCNILNELNFVHIKIVKRGVKRKLRNFVFVKIEKFIQNTKGFH